MKIFLLVNCGVEHHSVLGVYTSKEVAQKDMKFIVDEEIEKAISDDTFQERWVKIKDVWYNQVRWKSSHEQWGQWPQHDPDEDWTGDRIRIEEHEAGGLTLQECVDAVNAWQSNSMVHPLTCGNDSSHPDLVPYYDFCWPGIGLECTHKIDEDTWCGWRQRPDHPVLELVYATYLSNRPSAS